MLEGDVLGEQVRLERIAQKEIPRRLVVPASTLPPLRGTDAVSEVARPLHQALVGSRARRGGRAHPSRSESILPWPPVLPGKLFGSTVVTHQELVLGVDGVCSIGEGELEELGLGDRLRRARLDAQVAVDASEIVDLVAVAVARGHRVVRRVVEPSDIDAVGGTDARTQLASDALLHAVFVAAENVATVKPRGLRSLLVGILAGHSLPTQVLEGELEPEEEPQLTADLCPNACHLVDEGHSCSSSAVGSGTTVSIREAIGG